MPVYREKNKKKWTKDGRSYFFKCQYTDMYGNQKTKSSKLYKTSKEAKENEKIFLDKNKSSNVEVNPTFKQLCDEWLDYKRQKIKITTYYKTEKYVNKHIIPYFEKYKINSININVLLNWKYELNKLKISLEYQNKIIGCTKEIFKYAVIYYDFDQRIIERLQPYKIDNANDKKPTAKTNFWTYDEFKRFIKVVDNNFYYTLFNFLYYTGLRIGELQALKWSNIDLEKKTVEIKHTLSDKINGQSYVILDPKTKNSNRIVDLSDNLVEIMKKHRLNEEKVYGFNEDYFIFGNVRFLALTTTRRYLKNYIEKAGVKKITIHGFRHSHVSLLIYLGCDSRDVAERIGDTVPMVEKTYYHMYPEKKKETINRLNSL